MVPIHDMLPNIRVIDGDAAPAIVMIQDCVFGSVFTLTRLRVGTLL